MSGETVLVRNASNSQIDTVENFYTAPSNIDGVLISKFTASNNKTNGISYKAYIYDSSGVLVEPVIPFTIVARDRFDEGLGIAGHIIPPGGSLRIESSEIDGLNYYVTGQELTS